MPTRRLFALAWLACVPACLAGRQPETAAPPERDVWYSISDGQQAYGYLHVVVRRLDDGAAEYAVDSLLKVELFDTPQEFASSSTTVVGPDLALRSMESESEQQSGRTRIRVRAEDGGYAVEREQDGATHASSFELDDELPSIPNLALGDWLHRLAVESGPGDADLARRVRIINADSGEPEETTVRLLERDASGSSWELDSGQEWSRTKVRLDAEGVMLEQSTDSPPLRVARAAREQALRIEHRVMPDRELLVFPFDRDVPPARRLAALEVQLTWQDIPREELVLEDARQRLVSLDEGAGRTTAVVRLERPAEGGADATLPLPRAEFAATLASGDFILPDDERIAARAAEIVGDETSARAAAAAICRWVADYIQPAMIAETLSGPQVLERRVGKCTEYTTLFASLARAAGLPTRVVLGERRFAGAQGDTWGGHMWNEVFVGEWIPVDASANEVGGSLDLLKLVHSDTVMGTQTLRWKLTRSLGISIASVEELPDAGGPVLQTGLDGTLYTDAEHGFQVRLPDETWTAEAKQEAGASVLRLRPPDPDLGDSAMFHVTAFSIPKNVPPKMLLDGRLNQQRASLDGVEVLRDEPADAAGARGHRITFGGVPKAAGGVPIRVSEVMLIHGETGVLVNLIATAELHELKQEVLEQIASSVSFLE